jgi:excisionase family DNA binding protein
LLLLPQLTTKWQAAGPRFEFHQAVGDGRLAHRNGEPPSAKGGPPIANDVGGRDAMPAETTPQTDQPPSWRDALRVRLRAARAANPVPSNRETTEQILARLKAMRFDPDVPILDDGEEAQPVEPVRQDAVLLTLDEAAAYLNITAEQVSAFIADGTLDYINVGRGKRRPRIRFTKQDLDAFIERRRQREVICRSTSPATRRITTSISSSKVIGFTARRAALLAGKPKPTKR